MTYDNGPLKVQDQFGNMIQLRLGQIEDYQKDIEVMTACRTKLMPILGNIEFPPIRGWDFSVWDGYIGLTFPYDFAVISQVAAQLKIVGCILKKEDGAGKGFLKQRWDVPTSDGTIFEMELTYLPDRTGSTCKKVPIETVQEMITKVITWDIVCEEAEEEASS